jgi:hypothetical protein
MDQIFNSDNLTTGYVVDVYDINNPLNKSKYVTEYNVMAFLSRGRGKQTPILFRNCILSNMFGNAADYSEYTLRADPVTNENGRLVSKGSVVLLLCNNGNSSQPFIIGAAKTKYRPIDDPNLGHHFVWEFNGVNLSINDDGSVALTHKGPTDIDGQAKDLTSNYTQASMTADGSLVFKNDSGDSATLSKGALSIVTTQTINLQAPSITLTNGVGPNYPILRADPEYVSAFEAQQAALTAAVTSLSTFTATLLGILNATPPPAPVIPFKPLIPSAVALQTACAALLPTIETQTATVTPGIAISVTTESS